MTMKQNFDIKNAAPSCTLFVNVVFFFYNFFFFDYKL